MTDIIPLTPLPRYLQELERDPGLLSLHTRTQYRYNLTLFETWRNDRPLTVTLVESYVAGLQKEKYSGATIRQSLACIRWLARRVIKVAFDELPEPKAEEVEKRMRRIIAIPDPKSAGRDPLPAGRHVPLGEVQTLIDACKDGTPAGARDAAMIAITADVGVRNEELRGITLSDIVYYTNEETPAAEITIRHGKGDKPRVVDIFGDTLELLTKWVEVRGMDGRYLFTPIYRGGNIGTSKQISYGTTRKILQHRFTLSGIEKGVTWHDFRRSAVGRLFDEGVDISTIMKITGHQDTKTPLRYDRRPEDRRRTALRKIKRG